MVRDLSNERFQSITHNLNFMYTILIDLIRVKSLLQHHWLYRWRQREIKYKGLEEQSERKVVP